MKKIIGIVIVSLMFCNIGYAKMRVIESKTLNVSYQNDINIVRVCIDRYEYVVMGTDRTDYNSPNAGIVQSFNTAGNPREC